MYSVPFSVAEKQEIRTLISEELQATIIPQLKEMVQSSAAASQPTATPSVDPAQLPALPDGTTDEKLKLIYREMSLRFDHLLKVMEIDRNNTNRRFTEMREYSDRRFGAMIKIMELDRAHTDKRFEEIEKRFKVIYWILGLMITLGSGFAALMANMLYRILQAL